jgi:hypothetical protein
VENRAGLARYVDSEGESGAMKINRILYIALPFFLFFNCSNPVSEDEKEATVKTIIEGTLLAGTHILFWDGTDKNNKYVSAGTYYVLLYTQALTYPEYRITALPGGTGKTNESPIKYIDNMPATTGIEYADPDTFHVEDGTNIHFTLDEDTPIRLTIRNRE